MKFKVKYSFIHNNKKREGIADIDNWYLLDQQGKMWSYNVYGDMHKINQKDYKTVPLFLINDEWLTEKEIKRRCKK